MSSQTRFFNALRQLATSIDLEDEHQLAEACRGLLSSVPIKRQAQVENELIAVALEIDAEAASMVERSRLIQKGFNELLFRAVENAGHDRPVSRR